MQKCIGFYLFSKFNIQIYKTKYRNFIIIEFENNGKKNKMAR